MLWLKIRVSFFRHPVLEYVHVVLEILSSPSKVVHYFHRVKMLQHVNIVFVCFCTKLWLMISIIPQKGKIFAIKQFGKLSFKISINIIYFILVLRCIYLSTSHKKVHTNLRGNNFTLDSNIWLISILQLRSVIANLFHYFILVLRCIMVGYFLDGVRAQACQVQSNVQSEIF